MANSSTNINKSNNHILSQTIEHKHYQDVPSMVRYKFNDPKLKMNVTTEEFQECHNKHIGFIECSFAYSHSFYSLGSLTSWVFNPQII